MMSDPAELETEQRKQAGFAATFDRLVESNLQLVKTVRAAIIVVSACAVLSLSWCAFTSYSMHGTLLEMRVMLQTVLEAVVKKPS